MNEDLNFPKQDKPTLYNPPAAGESGILAGECVEGFRINFVIGQGPRSYLHEGEQVTLRRKVAIKVLKRSFVTDVKQITDFLEAGRSCSSLIHPHIVQIYNVISAGDLYFIVSELVQDKCVAELADSGTMQTESVLRLLAEAAAALHQAHSRGIVHGNLAPTNIFYGEETGTRIADFLHDPFAGFGFKTKGWQSKRALFLSPEQLGGGAASIAGDIFSLAANAFLLATGGEPYNEEEIQQFVNGEGGVISPVAHEANPGVPMALSDLLGDMLHPDPLHRPVSMETVSERIDKVVETLRLSNTGDHKLLSKIKSLKEPCRRKYKRLRTDMDVKITPRSTSEKSALMLLSKIENISENGAFINMQNPPPIGTFVTLEFNLTPDGTRVNALGVVRWISRDLDNLGIGVQFLEVSTTSRKHLRHFVDKRMAREIAHALSRTQTHKIILKALVCHWGQDIPLDSLVKSTGTGRALLSKVLADFEKYGLIKLKLNAIECIAPATPGINEALHNMIGC